MVPAPKTSRHDGKGSRTIPIFEDVRPCLEEAFELAGPGATRVIGGNHLEKANGPNGWMNCNLRTAFGKLIKRAGLKAWPRLFHNLRSSRETELMEQFPVQVVALWMGHDAKMCLKHYAQTTEEHSQRDRWRRIRRASGAESSAAGGREESHGTEGVDGKRSRGSV